MIAKKFKPLITLAITGLVTSIASFAIWAAVQDDSTTLVFGEIGSIEADAINVLDRNNRSTHIVIDAETRIERQRSPLSIVDLQVGNFVRISGEPLEPGSVRAKAIFVVRAPPPKP